MERRPLTTGLHAIPNADPNAVRQFVTQEQPPALLEATEAKPTTTATRDAAPRLGVGNVISPGAGSRRKSPGIAPVGLIPVTVRLRPELAGALKRASLERQLAGEEAFTQQELVEQALEPWLRSLGYVD
jgi:hypothetical protein